MFVLRVGIEIPKIEVQFDHLSVEGEVHTGSRALPSLLNSTLNTIEVLSITTIFLRINMTSLCKYCSSSSGVFICL